MPSVSHKRMSSTLPDEEVRLNSRASLLRPRPSLPCPDACNLASVFNHGVLSLLCGGSSKHFFLGSRDFLIPTPKLPRLVRSRTAGSSIVQLFNCVLREESNMQEGSVIR